MTFKGYGARISVSNSTMVRFDTERKVNAMCKVIGYCRVSTKHQNLDRQIKNITAAYPNATIYKEAYTGTKIDRPEWNKLYKKAKSGDTLVFDSVSRMSRNAEEGIKTYFELYDRGVNLVFVKEPHINTATYSESISNSLQMTGNEIADCYIDATNKVIKILAEKQIKLAFEQAQKEVDDLHQRTKEGIKAAGQKGKQIGGVKGRKLNVKKAKSAKEVIQKHSKDFNGTLEDSDVIKLAGISRNTYYKYKRELKDEI